MRSSWVRFWILSVLLAGVASLSLARLLLAGAQEEWVDLSRLIPERLGDWRGRDLAIDEGTRRLLGAKNVLMREYVFEGSALTRPPVLLCITFSAGSHRIAHPAEVCYEGQGWDVTVNEEIELDLNGGGAGQAVNHLSISRKGERCGVIVWYRTSSRETSSFIRQKLEMLLGNLFGGRRWSAMIRLSALEDPTIEGAAFGSLRDFGRALHPHLDVLGLEMESR